MSKTVPIMGGCKIPDFGLSIYGSPTKDVFDSLSNRQRYSAVAKSYRGGEYLVHRYDENCSLWWPFDNWQWHVNVMGASISSGAETKWGAIYAARREIKNREGNK